MTQPQPPRPMLSPLAHAEDRLHGYDLRPRTLEEYIGQDGVVSKLRLMIAAARTRGEPLEHVLFHGPPGLGKTSLAHVIGREMGARLVVTAGPVLERTGDLAAILTQLQRGDILFVDEIHRLPKGVEELLYPALEDFRLDLVIGQGPMARTTTLRLHHFTLVGATTRAGLIGAPLRDRFGMAFRLNFYDHESLASIVCRSAERLGLEISQEAARVIAKRSRGTPRIANRLVRRVRDYGSVSGISKLDATVAQDALTVFEIDSYGCDPMDRLILHTIITKFSGGPVGIETIAAALSEDVGTLEDFFEPYLMQLGFLQRTSRGRMATEMAYQYLGVSYPKESQPTLF